MEPACPKRPCPFYRLLAGHTGEYAESIHLAGYGSRTDYRAWTSLRRPYGNECRIPCRSGGAYERDLPKRPAHIGRTQIRGGRIAEPAATGLTEQLISLGIQTDRMKTGTPVRIDGRSVHFDEMEEQPGENDFHKFSYMDTSHRKLKQLSCWTTFTNEACHDILREGLPDSPLYNGQIKSIGPRYCPSIETKIVTFADKTRINYS